MSTYYVTVRATGHQSWLVEAKSKAEAIRKIKENRDPGKPFEWDHEINGLDGGLDKMHWSTAEAEVDD